MTTHNPALTNPKSGMRNQKNASCEPRSASFFAKSMAGNEELPCELRVLLDTGAVWSGEPETEKARQERASRRTGKDERKQRSNPSAKVMNMPVPRISLAAF